MAVLLSLCAAVCFGVSDFSAGIATRRTNALFVCLVVEASGLVFTLAVLPFTVTSTPSAAATLWGLVSGVGTAVGTFALYYGFGLANLNVVGPLSSVAATAFPAITGLALGERPHALVITGVLAAVPAVWLVSLEPQQSGSALAQRRRAALQRGAVFGLVAGAGFALMFIALDRAGGDHGLIPVILGQLSALAIFSFAQMRTGFNGLPSWKSLGISTAAGISGCAAVILYFIATHVGLLVIAVVLTTLYPAVTILLARLFLREHLSILRGMGLALAGVATTLIIIGTYS
jgi:drug/metabolite transporter (DMT)-like permease